MNKKDLARCDVSFLKKSFTPNTGSDKTIVRKKKNQVQHTELEGKKKEKRSPSEPNHWATDLGGLCDLSQANLRVPICTRNVVIDNVIKLWKMCYDKNKRPYLYSFFKYIIESFLHKMTFQLRSVLLQVFPYWMQANKDRLK